MNSIQYYDGRHYRVKVCPPALCPLMDDIITSFLESGVVPSSFRSASVTPILKKPGLDPDDPSHPTPSS